jgi:hypothetical protein
MKPPEPWRNPETENDFLGLQEPYRPPNADPGDGGRLGGEFVYKNVEGVDPGAAGKRMGQCNLF